MLEERWEVTSSLYINDSLPCLFLTFVQAVGRAVNIERKGGPIIC